MGADKAGLSWQGSTLLERMVRELGAHERELLISVGSVEAAAVYGRLLEAATLSAGSCARPEPGKTEQSAATYMQPDITIALPRFIPDLQPGCGPLGGIYSVLREAQTDAVFFCAVDMPFVTERTVAYLEQFLCNDFDGVVFTEGGRLHPLCGIYRRALLPVLERQLEQGDYRVRSLMDTGRIKAVPLEWSALPVRTLWNLNTPEDYRRAARPLVFCVSGEKNSGKTTLIEKLVRYFLPEFPRIGVIKHDGHDFSMDREGTDSFRAAQAGAQKTAVFSGKHVALLETFPERGAELEPNQKPDAEPEPDPAQRYAPLQALLAQMQDMDMVILEGMKDSAYPKVELVQRSNGASCLCSPDTLIAVATDIIPPDTAGQTESDPPAPFPPQIPVIDRNDTERIGQAILRYFLPSFP